MTGKDILLAFWLLNCLFHSGQGQVSSGTKLERAGQLPKYYVVIRDYPRENGQTLKYQTFAKTFCGGTILNTQWVLTAAHCPESEVSEDKTCPRRYDPILRLKVLAGLKEFEGSSLLFKTKKLSSLEPKFEQVKIAHFWISHPEFCDSTLLNDIALVMVDEPFDFKSGSLIPATLPNEMEEDLEKDVICTIYGWGPSETEGEEKGFILRRGTMRFLVEVKEEKRLYFNTEGMSASSPGDSGGPLICDGTVHGFISSEGKKHRDELPKVYSYMDWMEPIISMRTPGQVVHRRTVQENPSSFIAVLEVRYRRQKGDDWFFKCHGAFIGKQLLLTAAHCFDHYLLKTKSEESLLEVKEFRVSVPGGQGGWTSIEGNSYFRPKEYDESKKTITHDVAVVHLSQEITKFQGAKKTPISAYLPKNINKKADLRLSYFPANANEWLWHGDDFYSLDEITVGAVEEENVPRFRNYNKNQVKRLRSQMRSVKANGGFTPFSAILHSAEGKVIYGVKIHGQNHRSGAKQFTRIDHEKLMWWLKRCKANIERKIKHDEHCDRVESDEDDEPRGTVKRSRDASGEGAAKKIKAAQ